MGLPHVLGAKGQVPWAFHHEGGTFQTPPTDAIFLLHWQPVFNIRVMKSPPPHHSRGWITPGLSFSHEEYHNFRPKCISGKKKFKINLQYNN